MNDALLDNHLAFLRGHRGEVSPTESGYTIRSTRPEFTYGIALRDAAIDPTLRVVHRPAFGSASVERLGGERFRRIGALTYMTRSTAGASRTPGEEIRVEIARGLGDADRFSELQTRGFFDRDAEQAEWLPFMRQAARCNIVADDQTFFIARLGGEPVGVTLAVFTEVVGIYAVATPVAFRRRGVATALLDAALRRAADRGYRVATLQVAAGSDAERLYSRLGFETRFASEIWRRD